MKTCPDLGVQLAGFKMRNPTMLAAGILGISAEVIARILDAGAGAVVTKSISVHPREAYRNPTIVGVDCGYINAIGLANPGATNFKNELASMRDRDLPIVISVFGSSSEDFSQTISILEESMAKAFELNLSCPHVTGAGVEIGSDPEMVFEVVKAAKKATKKPVFVKISPNLSNVVSMAKLVEKAGADAVTATNTIRAMAIDIQTCKPILSNKVGGLSGPAIKPISLRCVYEITQQVKIPVIGCGGIRRWQDAVEYLLAGASAVQIGTALAYSGFNTFSAITDGIRRYISHKGFENVTDIVGLSH